METDLSIVFKPILKNTKTCTMDADLFFNESDLDDEMSEVVNPTPKVRQLTIQIFYSHLFLIPSPFPRDNGSRNV